MAGAVVEPPAGGGVVEAGGVVVVEAGGVVVLVEGAIVSPLVAGAVVVLEAGGVAAFSSDPEQAARASRAEAPRAREIFFILKDPLFECHRPITNVGPLRSIHGNHAKFRCVMPVTRR